MTPSHWSLDTDPPRDERLARLLRSAESADPAAVDWDGLHARILRGAGMAAGAPAAREWWDVVAQWRRVALAASVAAILAAAALLWRTGQSDTDVSLYDATPETAALARVVVAYPDEAVFTSMVEDAGTDELAAWTPR